MKFDKMSLKFKCHMVNNDGPNRGRRFVIAYFLADDTIAVYEPPSRNSGIWGGKFAERSLMKKKDGGYFSPSDFAVGAQVNLGGHDFIVDEVDAPTKKFLAGEEFGPKVTIEVIQNKVS